MKDFIFIILCVLSNSLIAQNVKIDSLVTQEYDELAEYPGGNAELMKFVKKNLDYPEYEKINNIEGKVFIEFVIDKNGKPTQLKIKRGVSPGLDAEALNIIRLMPLWKPGKVNGKAVKTRFVLPINFKLDEKIESEKYPLFNSNNNLGFYEYLMKNIKYPEQAKNDSLQGVVRVKCFFDKDGKLKDYYLHESLSKECNDEALRLIKNMPQWKKGKNQKREQTIILTIPFIFNESKR